MDLAEGKVGYSDGTLSVKMEEGAGEDGGRTGGRGGDRRGEEHERSTGKRVEIDGEVA